MKTTLWNSFKRIIGLSSLATYNTNASSQTYSRLFHTTRNTSLRTSVGTDSFWTQKYLFDRKVFNIPNRKYFLKPRQETLSPLPFRCLSDRRWTSRVSLRPFAYTWDCPFSAGFDSSSLPGIRPESQFQIERGLNPL
jgi:hypothetical protein